MKILVMQLAKIGDIIQTNQLLKMLRVEHEEAQIHLLVNSLFEEMKPLLEVDNLIGFNLGKALDQTGHVLQLNTYVTSFLNELLQNKYDLIINLNSIGFTKDLLEYFRADSSIALKGFHSNDNISQKWLYYVISFIKTREFATFNLVDIYKNICNLPGTRSSMPPSKPFKKPSTNRIVFQLGCRNIKRQWSISNFAELANLLIAEGKEICLVGSEEEFDLRDEFLKLILHKTSVSDLMGKTSLLELSQILKQSDLLISGDTGTMHIASSVGVEVFAIFLGPAYPWETLGYSADIKVVYPQSEKYICYPCQETADCLYNLACHTEITPHKVFKAIQNLLSLQVYHTRYDLIGQYLVPGAGSQLPLTKERYLAFVYRCFCLEWIFQTTSSLQDYLQDYSFTSEKLLEWKEMLLKEWRKFQILFDKNLDYSSFQMNLPNLAPLYYWHKLFNEQEKDLFTDWEKYLNGL